MAIVDQGTSTAPTVLWEDTAADDTADPTPASEFATWLATVRFS
jgi:hypothetical protein